MNTIIICLTVIFAPLIWEFTRKYFRPEVLPTPHNPTPYDALKNDLGEIFSKVFGQLRGDFKGDAFPKKVYFSNGGSWTPRDQVLPIVVAELERLGWVVWQDQNCLSTDVNTEIIVDVRRVSPRQVQTTAK